MSRYLYLFLIITFTLLCAAAAFAANYTARSTPSDRVAVDQAQDDQDAERCGEEERAFLDEMHPSIMRKAAQVDALYSSMQESRAATRNQADHMNEVFQRELAQYESEEYEIISEIYKNCGINMPRPDVLSIFWVPEGFY